MKVKVLITQSCLSDATPWTVACQVPPWDFSGKNTGVGCHSLLQEIFLMWGSNPDLQYYRWLLYHLSHQVSPLRGY